MTDCNAMPAVAVTANEAFVDGLGAPGLDIAVLDTGIAGATWARVLKARIWRLARGRERRVLADVGGGS